jgi:hypothetical protein
MPVAVPPVQAELGAPPHRVDDHVRPRARLVEHGALQEAEGLGPGVLADASAEGGEAQAEGQFEEKVRVLFGPFVRRYILTR